MCQIPPGMRAGMDPQRQTHPLIVALRAVLEELGSGAADRWVILTAELLLIRVSLILFSPASVDPRQIPARLETRQRR